MSHQSGTGRRRGSFASPRSQRCRSPASPGPRRTPSDVVRTPPVAADVGAARRPRLLRREHVEPGGPAAGASVPQGRIGKEPAVGGRSASAPRPDRPRHRLRSTGTVRMLTRLDGFLTGASKRSASKIALGYVRQAPCGARPARERPQDVPPGARLPRHHRRAPPLLHPADRPAQERHRQRPHRGGEQGGSPAHRGRRPDEQVAARRRSRRRRRRVWRPRPAGALAAARGRRRPGADPSQDSADPRRVRHAARPPPGVADRRDVVGRAGRRRSSTPQTGKVLQRHPLVDYEPQHTGSVYRFFPGAHPRRQAGEGRLHQAPLAERARPRSCSGNNSHTYSDVNDNNRAVEDRGGPPAGTASPGATRSSRSRCRSRSRSAATRGRARGTRTSRSPGRPTAPRTPRRSSTSSTTGTTTCRRRRSASPRRPATSRRSTAAGQGKPAVTPVNTQTDDGANTDQRPARRQPHRQRQHGHAARRHRRRRCRCTCSTSRARRTPTATRSPRPTSATRPTPSTTSTPTACPTGSSSTSHGVSTLGGVQAGAMGEAWSDWYAMDYLVDQGLQTDKRRKADVRLFRVRRRGRQPRPHRADRLQGGPDAPSCCNGGTTGHGGGYTYADYGKVVGGPEVHGDGEIWAQTLWEPARASSARKHDRVAGDPGDGARAVQPVVPRHAQRDPGRRHVAATAAGTAHAHLEGVRRRGMGFFAGSLGGNDTAARRRASRRRRSTARDRADHRAR